MVALGAVYYVIFYVAHCWKKLKDGLGVKDREREREAEYRLNLFICRIWSNANANRSRFIYILAHARGGVTTHGIRSVFSFQKLKMNPNLTVG